MADHPRHPDTDDHAGAGHDRGTSTGSSPATYAFVLVAIVLVGGIVALHLAGVIGPGSH
jgi:hypothetical protein